MEQRKRLYKNRNILTPEERVEVIRDFKRTPKYTKLSFKYNCSPRQIKNIIKNKEAVLCRSGSADDKHNEALLQRQQKIAFLDKVIFEYIARALFHNIELTEDMVSVKAVEIKEAIAISNFYPYHLWLQNFKKTFNISSFDQHALRKVIKFDGLHRKSLNTIDLIQDVSKRERKMEQSGKTVEQTIFYIDPVDEKSVKSSTGQDCVTIILESDEESDKESNKTDIEIVTVSSTELPEVDCFQEALRHIKVLEEFAMLKENYRAIGLIAQLEQVLQNPPNNEEFEG